MERFKILYAFICLWITAFTKLIPRGQSVSGVIESTNRQASPDNTSALISSVASNNTDSSPGTWPWQIFKTESYNPPALEINANGGRLARGYFLISPSNFEPQSTPSAIKQSGPVIVTDKGKSKFRLI